MRVGSLRLRLGLAATVLIGLALLLAGFGLTLILDRVLDARTADDLDRTVKLLAGRVGVASDGAPTLSREPPDPRFTTPYGGLYWQVETPDGRALRSRSLWDKRLDGLRPADGDARSVVDVVGPEREQLLALSRTIEIGNAGTKLRITVAEDRRQMAESRATFIRLLVPSLFVLFAVLTLAMTIFVHRALAPFRALRADLAAVHAGTRGRLSGSFPDEVSPLVSDLNRLLDAQERALTRAQASAADMAHGLKTPLAILDALTRQHPDATPALSKEIAEQTRAMTGQVERALTRARLSRTDDLRRRSCPVAPVVEQLVATMRRLPEGDSLVWDLSISDTLTYPGDEGEVMDVLGNLLDNARKWAHRRVTISGEVDGVTASLTVSDDGPGMDKAVLAGLGRGIRLDESRPGTGFGLAIARDVAEAAGAQLTFERRFGGGLTVKVAWPPFPAAT
ncbi:HAMP domain-containing sensor histidine kinase [uncultured Methylobacterium sp.]|uniref:sensor histidine kinase n=1 Tax=uncultured Methylobacterium sp. TaxID=157278 RepID=UPI00258D2CC9|nr:HAMP domain-containing sensor histidine kinase [uncultured Methylobacterium sp.]